MVFLVNYVVKDSSGTIYVAFRDPEQILKIQECPGDSGTVGAYALAGRRGRKRVRTNELSIELALTPKLTYDHFSGQNSDNYTL